jgi:single-stranded-DNA-specific exonuclease
MFIASPLRVMESRIVGDKHLKIKVKQGKVIQEAIGFGLSDRHPLKGEIVDMVFTPEINYWQGYERIQLRINDLKAAKSSE